MTSIDCYGCYIRSDGPQLAVLGVIDLIIVAAGDRVLILLKGRSQKGKMLLETARAIGQGTSLMHHPGNPVRLEFADEWICISAFGV